MSNNKKTVLIASDIFGMSDDFSSLLEHINVADHAITVSPYQKPDVFFDSEQQAYECFQDYGGIDAYILKLTNVLMTHPDIKQVVGFSAGAAAIYKSMFDHSSNNINLILFYPSQIRHFLNNHPSSPCHIIFPKSEPHFSLQDIIKSLKQQSNIRIEQNTYQHGFMNKTSKAFNQNAYNHYCQMLKVLLAKKSNNTPIKYV